jgi:hypothetical protein
MQTLFAMVAMWPKIWQVRKVPMYPERAEPFTELINGCGQKLWACLVGVAMVPDDSREKLTRGL